MADYVLEGVKWGDVQLGAPGGTVTWSFLQFNFSGQHWNFDFALGSDFYSDVRRAFDAWEAVARIDFVEVADAQNNDIRLGIDSIDGAGNVSAETFWTSSSGSLLQAEIRFDTTSSENWHQSVNGIVSDGGVRFYAVALHEMGHALGLDHYAGAAAIMNAFLTASSTELTASDIHGVQAIYGAAQLASPPPVPPSTFSGVAAIGTSGPETIVGNSVANFIDGLAGNDYIGGGAGDDDLHGGDGNDRMDGHQDADYISGDAGDDVLYGGNGSDVVIGGEGQDVQVGDIIGTTELGDDVIYAGGGNDICYGGAGNDVIRGDDAIGTQGDDWMRGDDGNDIIFGFGGADRLFGSNGFDTLFGDDGNDVIFGEADNDFLAGGAGVDVLSGGDGNDILDGGLGTDNITTGNGFDVIILKRGETQGEIVTDFQAGTDDLSLQSFGAAAALVTNGNGVFTVNFSGGSETFVLNGVSSITAGTDFTFFG